APRYLIGAEIVHEQAGVVIGRFLVVRNNPALVHRITVEPAADLVVDAAAAHAFERRRHRVQQPALTSFKVGVQQQVDGARVRKLGRLAEPAVPRVKRPPDAFDDALGDRRAGLLAVRLELLDTAQSLGDPLGAVQNFALMSAVIVGDAFEHALHSGASVAVVRGEVRAAVKGLPVRGEERRERPAPLPSEGAHGHLVSRMDVRPLVAVDLDGDVVLVDDACEFLVLVTLPVHDVAPVAPYGPNVQKDGLVLAPRRLKGRIAPRTPLDGLMRGAAQVRAGSRGQGVAWPLLSHGAPSGLQLSLSGLAVLLLCTTLLALLSGSQSPFDRFFTRL